MAATAALTEVIERFAIRDQIENYSDALNHRDWDRSGNKLCEDLVWNIAASFSTRVTSRDRFVELCKTQQEPVYNFVFQMAHGIVVHEIVGNMARARHTMHELSSDFMMIGIYYDELRKGKDGVWRYRCREFSPTYVENSRAPGKIYRCLPDPSYRTVDAPAPQSGLEYGQAGLRAE